ncbi:MAG: dienelactone hydrolase family protein [Rikenellaceae bacterium]|nr:dienelactone hydrolase family protein [Rikenellaceae bacterium]
MKKAVLFLIFLCISTPFHGYGQQTVQKYVVQTDYLLYLPEGYDADTTARWPLGIFLHGAGETGTDIEKIKVHGLPKLVEQGMQFPFIGISPQSRQYGWQPRTVKGIADDAVAKYRVDTDRLYLTGLSMGGIGTWATAMEYPGFFAAILPICGGGDPERAYTLAYTPVWNFHGDADDVVPMERSEVIVEAARRYNPAVKFTAYPGVKHDSWTQTYENPEVWEWLLGQSKFRFREAQIVPDILPEYAGEYIPETHLGTDRADDPNNVIIIEPSGNTLQYIDGKYSRTYYPAGGDVFFSSPDSFSHIRFVRDSGGKVISMSYFHPEGIQTRVRKD